MLVLFLFLQMFFIYILYSSSADKYYIGYTTDINQRLHKHNYQDSFNTYTKKYRPWVIRALFECGDIEAEAMKLEKHIKRQKSRKLIELLCTPTFTPTATLSQLVRVPHVRD